MAEFSRSGFTMQGLSKTYYESGKLKAETNYTKDKPAGVGKEFYEAGQIMQEIHCADGSPQTKKVFYENGKMRQEWNYRVTGSGDLAVVTSYNPDGSPAGEKIVKKPKPKQRKKKLHTGDAFPEKAGAFR
jgi:antitoxin component YwqK of YwqJK toxin-antitoxin module